MNQMKPLFLIAGGHSRSPKSMVPLMAQALNECGRLKPRVAYVGTANGDNKIFYGAMRVLLKEAGAGEVFLLPLAKSKVKLSAVKQELETSDAVFLSGGEVEDGMCWLAQHGLVDFLKELRGKGKLFFGLSAGSIMMGAHWVRWENPDDDSTAELFDCLDFVPTIFDTHAEDEDWKELKMALRLRGSGEHGYGIPSGGMVVVDEQGTMTIPEKPLLCFVNNDGRVQQG